MANFKEAYDLTMGNEGGYSNNSADTGGETWYGISRRWNPGWPGWAMIDERKRLYGPVKPGYEAAFTYRVNTGEGHAKLEDLVLKFYKEKYWDPFKGDKFQSQRIANWMFDAVVLCGPVLPGQWLQTALNCLDAADKDLLLDGAVGPATISALQSAYSKGYEKYILCAIRAQRTHHFVEICQKSSGQRLFFRGWLNREMKE